MSLARKPPRMSFEEAAGIPVAALTAWKAMFDPGCLDRASAQGRRVRINGADVVLDYRAQKVEAAVQPPVDLAVGATLPLAAAAQAQDLSKQGGTPGKIILTID